MKKSWQDMETFPGKLTNSDLKEDYSKEGANQKKFDVLQLGLLY